MTKKTDSKKAKSTKVQYAKSEEIISHIDVFLGYWLRFVSNQVTSAFQQRLMERGVNVAEWFALRVLYSSQPCSLTELAEEIGMDKGVVSRLTDRLEKQGLIKRTIPMEDRRLFSIELTASGRKLVPVLAKIAQENDQRFFGHLSKEEIAAMTDFLKDLVVRHDFRSKPIT